MGALTRRVLAATGLALALAGCGDATLLRRPGASPTPPGAAASPAGASAESDYLTQLGADQARLAAAVKQIATRPRTPAALARAADRLAGAARELHLGLAAITPPSAVAAQHARLVEITGVYALALDRAARIAVTPGGGRTASYILTAATNTASRMFTATIAEIDSTLGASRT
ncbi:MAG: hypothetical protein JOZ64_15140 [Solirubrobacterales bacterium]|nr:hypothetical protein [Solirubrobacterales bacterium]